MSRFFFSRFSRNFFNFKSSFNASTTTSFATRHWKKGLVLFSLPTVAYVNQQGELYNGIIKDLKANPQLFEPVSGKDDKLESLFHATRDDKTKEYLLVPTNYPLYFQLFNEVWVCCEANSNVAERNPATSHMFVYSPLSYLLTSNPNDSSPGKYILVTEEIDEDKPFNAENGEVVVHKSIEDPSDSSNTLSKEVLFAVVDKTRTGTGRGAAAIQFNETNLKYRYSRNLLLVLEFDEEGEVEKFVSTLKDKFVTL